MIKKVLTEGGLFKIAPLTIEERQAEYEKALQECYEKRIAEYPKIEDYLDAQVKGDTAAMEAWKTQQLAVKAKYPKPLPSDFGL